METEFIVITSAARMPCTCWGRYRNVALCEVEKGKRPKMISERARGMVRIIDYRGKLNDGTTERCATARAIAELQAEADRLNADRA